MSLSLSSCFESMIVHKNTINDMKYIPLSYSLENPKMAVESCQSIEDAEAKFTDAKYLISVIIMYGCVSCYKRPEGKPED